MSKKKNLLGSLRKVWEQTSVPARASVITVGTLSIAIIAGVGWWAVQPHYVPLTSKLDPATAGEAISVLEENGIANKMNFNGSKILVDQSQWNKANQLIADIVPGGNIDTSSFGGSLMPDPATADLRMIKQKERELSETIKRFKPVESARVHLGIPAPTPFARQKKPKTASVNIAMRPNQQLSQKLSTAIISMVANSVEGLDPANVTLMDTDGNHFDFEDSTGSSAGFDNRRRIEQEMAQKVESMLNAVLGPGRSVVRVTADIELTKSEKKITTFDPKSRAVITEKITTEKGVTGDPLAAGPAGTSSNLGRSPVNSGSNQVVSDREESETTYQPAPSTETKTEMPGQIKRLSIAAIVQLTDSPSADTVNDGENDAAAAVPQISLESIKSLIQTAVGFDAKRRDEIEVVDVPRLTDESIALADLIEPPSVIESWMPLIRNISLGVAALVALLLGLLTLKRIKPIEISGDETPQGVSPQRARQLSELAILARKNPELLSSIMSAWMDPQDDEDSAPPNTKRNAA